MTTSGAPVGLLSSDEAAPVLAERPQGRSTFVIAVDHASSRIPRRLADLGLPTCELQRHVAWDIGALAVARRMAADLDAPLVAQNYSRLVIDCNRVPGTAESIPTLAETIEVSGNLGLTIGEIAARRTEIFDPYHAHLDALLEERLTGSRRSILVALHTMTHTFKGTRREMHAAVLYHHDQRFARLVLNALRRDDALAVAENEPYSVEDLHYTVPHHAERRGLPYVSLEIRQDLVTEMIGQGQWASRISDALRSAERLFRSQPESADPAPAG